MTTEEKAKRYDELFVKASRIYIKENDVLIMHTIEDLFPELKESEDEKVRRVLREIVLQWKNGHQAWCSDDKEIDSILAWLEKQSEKTSDKIVEKTRTEKQRVLLTETDGSAGIDWDTRSLQDVKLLLEYGLDYIKKLEKQSEQKSAKRPYSYELEEEIEEWLGCEAFPEGTNITPLPKAIEIVRETANHFYDFGRKQQSIRNIQYTNSQVITPESYINEGQKKGIQTVLDNPQEYGLQKPTDKAEPKFHVGDIIIHKENGAISKVNKILSYDYELISFETENTLFLDQNIINENSKLWTIQDAKDGDVLRVKNLTFIFQEITNDNVCHEDAAVACCSYEDNDDGFGVSGPDCITDLKLITPAAKEQRDLLFQKMKEAGYEWDAEKKELKKIVAPIFNIGDTIIKKHNSDINDFGSFTITDITGGKYWYNDRIICDITEQDEWEIYEPVRQKSAAWSEEDEEMLKIVIKSCEQCGNEYAYYWLKSLRPRNRWKPSEEQIDALDKGRIYIPTTNIERKFIDSLLEDLKKLMG